MEKKIKATSGWQKETGFSFPNSPASKMKLVGSKTSTIG
jgi:hypothetical protein